MKKTFLLLSFISCVSFANAQSWEWAKAALNTNTSQYNSTTVDKDGNVIAVGLFAGKTIKIDSLTLTNTNPGGGSNDIVIAKYDANGNLLWGKSFGGKAPGNSFYDDMAYAVVTDTSGNIYMGGSFNYGTIVFGTVTLICGNGTDMFVVKFDKNGNAIWGKSFSSYGSTSIDMVTCLSMDAAGNLYVGASYGGDSIKIGSKTFVAVGYPDLLILKFDSQANLLWSKSFGGYGNDLFNAMAVDAAGNVYVAGGYNGLNIIFGSITLNNVHSGTNYYDVFLAKYDSSGNVIWAKTAGGDNTAFSPDDDDRAFGVGCDRSGNVYLTGAFKSQVLNLDTIKLSMGSLGAYVLFVAQYNSSGKIQWAKTEGYGQSYEMKMDSLDNAYILTAFPSILRYNSAGVKQWNKTGINCSSVTARSFALNTVGDIYTAGWFKCASMTLDTVTLINPTPYTNIWVAKLGSTIVGTDEYFNDHNSFIIFPNPCTNQFTISFSKTISNRLLKIFNVMGREVYSETVNGKQETVNSKLPSGIYFVLVRDEERQWVEKVVVE